MKRIGLVAFGNKVRIIGDGTPDRKIVIDKIEELNNEKALEERIKNSPPLIPISSSYENIMSEIEK